MKFDASRDIRAGYFPGVIGTIVRFHAEYYHERWGFGPAFETQVARELSEFITGFDEGRDGLWTANADGRFAGSVAVQRDRIDPSRSRLRWFLVDPAAQGEGVGGALLDTAVRFSRGAGYSCLYLWTFEGLDPARRLYERQGFRQTRQLEGAPWGRPITEQMFELPLD